MTPSEAASLTVVLAVKDPPAAQFEACVASIAGLRHSPRFDLVIVASGGLPPISSSCRARLHRLAVIEQEPRGVYAAYNRGIDEVCTPYVMVMGCDDLLLPGIDRVFDVLHAIANDARPHLVAARALVQDIGVTRPSRFRCELIFRNWCQQALLYRTDLFASKRFDCKYPVQADHKFNLELVSDRRTVVLYRDDIICHFSSGGLSKTIRDWAFREDMPDIVRACYGNFFWILALTKRGLADVFRHRSWIHRAERTAALAKNPDSTSGT